ncbi:hypothetical protein Acy02nite_47080 [Actinoplanes cyaneus]|uniref:Antitoxin SocA-like Panacea domain-containing protein n=1 Tax=Actinoplanes cyaneus TaxID=52696 RepID=A0A919IM37_9ACTN|nr:type II toxin-antitoxin system antitoxin SocA domain-containing protein [Actinoplanes cyaneus]GID66827.1 hypothetical protein Acy02nite_47080 [Actinoplanes cyaneus]
MAEVLDVAAYILDKAGPMSAMKLQKLCYYAQSWHMVWESRPLFDDRIEAWANGPVAPSLYRVHRGKFTVSSSDIPGDADELDSGEKESIDAVLEFYGTKGAHELSELTHRETPWVEARRSAGLAPMEPGTAEISPASIAEYYDGLTSAEN